jgi:glyoxylase I family protein
MKARFAHVNLITRDWRRLAQCYTTVFGCVMVPPERAFQDKDLDAGTGLKGADMRGAHCRLPGDGGQGPTLEIFSYDHLEPSSPAAANRPRCGHIAFEVEDVAAARQEGLSAGGGAVGEIAWRSREKMACTPRTDSDQGPLCCAVLSSQNRKESGLLPPGHDDCHCIAYADGIAESASRLGKPGWSWSASWVTPVPTGQGCDFDPARLRCHRAPWAASCSTICSSRQPGRSWWDSGQRLRGRSGSARGTGSGRSHRQRSGPDVTCAGRSFERQVGSSVGPGEMAFVEGNSGVPRHICLNLTRSLS